MVQGVIDSWYLVDLMEIETNHRKAKEIAHELKAGIEESEEIRNSGNSGRKEVELYVLLDSVSRGMRGIKETTAGSRRREKKSINILVLLLKEDLRNHSEGRICSSRSLDTEISKRVFKQRDNEANIQTKSLPMTITKKQSSVVFQDISSDEEKVYQVNNSSRINTSKTHKDIKYQPTPSKLIPTATSSPPRELRLPNPPPKDTRKRPRDDSSSFPLSKKAKKNPIIVPEINSSIIKRAKKLDPTSALRKALSELDP